MLVINLNWHSTINQNIYSNRYSNLATEYVLSLLRHWDKDRESMKPLRNIHPNSRVASLSPELCLNSLSELKESTKQNCHRGLLLILESCGTCRWCQGEGTRVQWECWEETTSTKKRLSEGKLSRSRLSRGGYQGAELSSLSAHVALLWLAGRCQFGVRERRRRLRDTSSCGSLTWDIIIIRKW